MRILIRNQETKILISIQEIKKNVQLNLNPIAEELEQDISAIIQNQKKSEDRQDLDSGPQIEVGKLSHHK